MNPNMSRETTTIKLSNCEVDIITHLKWGEKEAIESFLLKGAQVDASGLRGFDASSLLDSKYKTLSTCVVEIREGDKKSQFTNEWMNDLSVEDGDMLYNAVNEVTTKKKEIV